MLGHPVKVNVLDVLRNVSIGQSIYELESGNRNVDRQTNGQKTDT